MDRFRIKKTRTYNRALPLLMPAGVALYHWSRPSNKLKIAQIQSKVIDTAKSPEFKDAISEITPFLDLGVQHILYTTMGIIDILSATKNLSDGSFQKQHMKIPFAGETKIGIRPIVKAIKRLKADVNGQVLDNAILSYEISDKLFSLMRKENRGGNPTSFAANLLDDLLGVLKPLIPQKHFSNIGKFTKLIKIAQAINATDEIMANSDAHSTDSDSKRENPDRNPSETENPNVGSLDMIAKLVSLLS